MAENLTTDPTLPRAPTELSARPQTDPEHLLPAHTSPGEAGEVAVDDPDTARAEIGRTRARMSATLDSIEAALVQRKEALVRRKEEIQ